MAKSNRALRARASRPRSRAGEALEPIEISSRRDLLTRQVDLAQRMAVRPELAALLLDDPMRAFERLGVRMSPQVAGDVLQAIGRPQNRK
ncbi:MAG TPA: hypothetical protein VFZ93_08905 [Albitalea sp.]